MVKPHPDKMGDSDSTSDTPTLFGTLEVNDSIDRSH